MNGFMSAMKSTLNDEFNVSVTENGAVGYRTTGKELLDLNFAVASLRKASPSDIANRFVRAFFEDKITAMKWLFFARDVPHRVSAYGGGKSGIHHSADFPCA